jgi:Cu-Zn family superoxide dismutase
MRVTTPTRIWLATVISGICGCAALVQQASAQHRHAQVATTAVRQPPYTVLDDLDDLYERFEGLLARTNGRRRWPGPNRRAEMFDEFLLWPRNPYRIEIPVRRTSTAGVGEPIGTIAVGNGEIMVAGRKEVGLFVKPNLRGLPPGFYAFHVHEKPECGPAMREGEMVPGLAAGGHLWLSGTGAMSGIVFTSHLGDLPDLEVDADGVARKEIVAARLTLADVVNRAFIVHASQDDNSARMACAALK